MRRKRVGGGGLPSQVQYSGRWLIHGEHPAERGSRKHEPFVGLISEFKVTQFNNNAEFSQLGDVTISTESGTDKFHGAPFEYFQNSAFDAAVWGSNINGSTLKPHKVSTRLAEAWVGQLLIPAWNAANPKHFSSQIMKASQRYSTPLFLFVPTVGCVRRFLGPTSPLTDPSREALCWEQNPKRNPMREEKCFGFAAFHARDQHWPTQASAKRVETLCGFSVLPLIFDPQTAASKALF